MRRTQQWVRLERLERLVPPSPAAEPSEPQIDLHKVIQALLALAEGRRSLADALSPEERRYMEEQLPPLSALQALLRHLDSQQERPSSLTQNQAGSGSGPAHRPSPPKT